MSNLKNKLQCLFGSHTFDERWQIHQYKTYFICSSCRKYAQEIYLLGEPEEYRIVKETPEYIWIQVYATVVLYKKELDGTLIHLDLRVPKVPFGDYEET